MKIWADQNCGHFGGPRGKIFVERHNVGVDRAGKDIDCCHILIQIVMQLFPE